jgi:hypothetical protein
MAQKPCGAGKKPHASVDVTHVFPGISPKIPKKEAQGGFKSSLTRNAWWRLAHSAHAEWAKQPVRRKKDSCQPRLPWLCLGHDLATKLAEAASGQVCVKSQVTSVSHERSRISRTDQRRH